MEPKIRKTTIVKQYLTPLKPDDPKNVHFVCQMESCKSVLSGSKGCNLVTHFEKKHPEIFQLWDGGINTPNEWKIRRLEHIHYLSEIVTINNRPFASLQDSGFVKLRSRELTKLQEAGCGEGLMGRCPAVIGHIADWASEIKKKIRLEIKESLVSLMVDIGSKNGRDMLGISLQFVRDGRVVIRSIGMIQLTTSHTALNIKDEILAVLKEFDVQPSQVISITSDNASNMLSMIKLFNQESNGDNEIQGMVCNENKEEEKEEEEDVPLNKNENIYDDDVIRAEIDHILDEFNFVNTMSDAALEETVQREAEIFELLDDSSHYIELLKSLQNDFIMHTMNSMGIRCAAHTLQLAVKNALKAKNIRIIIDMCRIACKLLRKSAYKNKIREQNLKVVVPPLDCEVRWNSTYTMVITNDYHPTLVFLRPFLPFYYKNYKLQTGGRCNPAL